MCSHKKTPETNNVRMLVILILFIVPFLNYCGLPVVSSDKLFCYRKKFFLTFFYSTVVIVGLKLRDKNI